MPQLVFYRYTDDREAAIIEQTGAIEVRPGQDGKWYSPDRYETAADARRFLALAYTPTRRVGPIPADDLPPFDHSALRTVGVAYGQSSGGLEAATTQPLYLFRIARLAQ